MGLDFDIYEFCKKLRQCKPPYDCPIKACDKVYKSVCGLQYHLNNHNHEGEQSTSPSNPAPARKKSKSHRSDGAHRPKFPAPNESSEPPAREGLTYAEAQKMVEIDVGGRVQRINICDTLEIMSKDEYEKYIAAGMTDGMRMDSSLKMPCMGSNRESMTSIGSISSIMVGASKLSSVGDDRGGKLPEPSFRCIENYDIPDAPEKPNSYIRFIERSPDELDAEVEYDMDEEDVAWLNIINGQRESNSLPPVSMETFELLMDRFEKESYFEVMQTNGKDGSTVIDDDAVCCICMDGECQNSNVILFCDMCNLAVHQDCYGVPYIPEGQWWCRRCLQSPSRAVDCVLCPNNGGAFKQTDQGHWAHVVCALWIPEVRFANTVFLEPIDSIETIPPARWKLTCYICKQRGVGACIQCHKTNCYAAFHVTCAQQAGLYMKMDTVREANGIPSGTPGESAVLIQKTAFCDLHTPPDSESRPRVREKGDAKEESRQKMKKARKILAQKRSSIPVISIPTIPPERIIEIAMLVDMPQRNYFIQRLISYWTLKRQNRNGVPLLRRLQATHQARPDERPVGEKIASKSELCQQLKYWQCLRQDLERARLLCELVRKREKLKKEFVKVKEKTLELELHPLVCFLRRVLEMIKSRDAGEIFSEPVDPGEVPDYGDVVKNPMDLSTMRQKLENFHYKDLDEFEADFSLMLHNCMAYNPKETVFYRAAVKMRDQGGAIIRQARRDFDNIGFDVESGTMLPERPRANGQPADEKIVEEVDQVLNSDERKNLSPQDHLNKLLELLEKSQKLQHAILRAKRTRIIKKEITKLRRRLAFERSGSLPGRKVSSSAVKESPVLNIRGRRRTLSKNSSTPIPAEKSSKSPRRKSIDASPDIQMKSEDGFESDSEAECSSGGEAITPAVAAVVSEEGEEEKKVSPIPRRRSRKSIKEEPVQENLATEKELHKKSSTPSTTPNTPYQTRKSALKLQAAEPAVAEVSPVERVSRRQSMRHQSEVSTPLSPRSRRGVSVETKVTRSGREVKEPAAKTPVQKPGKTGKGTNTAPAKMASTPTKVATPPEEPPVLVAAVENEDIDETDTPKRGRRKKIPKRQWGDDVSSAQGEPAAAKISPIQRRSSSQQQSLSSQGPPPEPRKSPLRLRQATPDASQAKPASSQSLQTHPKVGIGAAAKSLGSGGKPSSVAVKMAATPSAKPPGQSSSKPLGAAITSLPVTPLSSPLLSTPTKTDSQGLPLTQSNQQQQVSSGGSTGSPSGVNRRTAVLFTRKAAAAAFRKPDTPTPAAPKRRVGRPRKNLDAALGTVASPPASSSPLMLPGTSPLSVIGDSQGHLKGPLNSTSAAHLSQTDPSSPIVPATESFRVYRSGGDIPAETDDDSQSDSSSSSCSSSGSSSGSDGGGSSDDEEEEGHPPHSESSGDEGGGGADEMGGNAGTSTGGHRHQTGQQLSCGVVPLKPLDLVWAKCRGYPWYPALIIDPKMPKTGILHNGVPIPAAPADVLALSLNYTEPVFLVLFFDTKRTWQWLPRNKLEPLGMSTELDESKLTESRKPTERKAVRKAFQEAMQYQCQVSGQSGETPLSSQVSLQPLNTSISVTHSLSSANPGQSSIAL